ncbi:MAG: aquaporin family protein, partial [Candidatus Eremiobacteraeota bacterium]|nr:aquaporin family protein [Candidatus Eremiobacteraeota bacterium]
MEIFLAEIVGTALLILLGDGVVANVVLDKTKGNNSGWIVITAGWAMGVAFAVYAVGRVSGAHLNPAVTLALASIGELKWNLVPLYFGAQMVGAFLGAVLVFISYHGHWKETEDPDAKLAVFCTAPAIPNKGANFVTEAIGTAVLVFGVLAIGANAGTIQGVDLQAAFSTALNPLLVGLLVFSIGLSLGGPTGYAINPARDLGPRIAHAVLPVAGKRDSDWGYSWVPVVGPLV